jgi:regulator of sigma E protease
LTALPFALTWATFWKDVEYVVIAVFVIAFMILTHELGHYFAAKRVGIKVDQFSIGFGPEIKGWDRGETRWSLKWILAGGSVRIAGMNPEEEISPEDLPRTYYEAPYWKRAVVIVAGSAVHVVIALLLFYLLFWPVGHQEVTDTNKIGGVEKTVAISNSKTVPGPAYVVGLEKGDIIKSIDGNPTRDWKQLTTQLSKRPNQTVTLVYQRNGQTYTAEATLIKVDKRGILGVFQSTKVVRTNPIAAIGESFRTLALTTGAIFKGFANLFSVHTLKLLIGKAPVTAERPRSIIGAGQVAVQAARQGWDIFIFIIAEFFLLLAIFNLLPLPPLDGGHLLVIVIEKVFHRKVNMMKFAAVAWVVIIVLSLVALRLAMIDLTGH